MAVWVLGLSLQGDGVVFFTESESQNQGGWKNTFEIHGFQPMTKHHRVTQIMALSAVPSRDSDSTTYQADHSNVNNPFYEEIPPDILPVSIANACLSAKEVCREVKNAHSPST